MIVTLVAICLHGFSTHAQETGDRSARARDLGVVVGVLPHGPLNAITAVAGVAGGHTTIIHGSDVRTGVTAVLPHLGNLFQFQRKVIGAVHVGNAFGKPVGSTQVQEPRLDRDAHPADLDAQRAPCRRRGHRLHAGAAGQRTGPVDQSGSGRDQRRVVERHPEPTNLERRCRRGDPLGARRSGRRGRGRRRHGHRAFGFKGGIGTASQRVPEASGGYTVGVLVQTNFGGVLTINGAPVGQELGRYYLRDQIEPDAPARPGDNADGSVIIVVGTDAPVDTRNLERLAARAMFGLARTGAAGSNGSGDYVIAFSTANAIDDGGPQTVTVLGNDDMSPLFLGVIEATEEAIYNSLFRATDMTGHGRTVEALPIEQTLEIMRRYGAARVP